MACMALVASRSNLPQLICSRAAVSWILQTFTNTLPGLNHLAGGLGYHPGADRFADRFMARRKHRPHY